jgi:hypothetical protein
LFAIVFSNGRRVGIRFAFKKYLDTSIPFFSLCLCVSVAINLLLAKIKTFVTVRDKGKTNKWIVKAVYFIR